MTYKKTICLSLFLAFLTVFAGCNDSFNSRAKYQSKQNYSVDTDFAQIIEIVNQVGDINIVGTNDKVCEIEAVITAKSKSIEKAKEIAENVKIQSSPVDNCIKITVEKPQDENKGNQVVVDLTIKIPKDLQVKVRNQVGNITITSINGCIVVTNDVGNISCKDVKRSLDVKTNVGNAKVDFYKNADPACNATINVNVGNIRLSSPENLSAKIYIATDIGSINTGLSLTVKGKIGKTVNAQIADAKGTIDLKTQVGSIYIR